MTALRTITGLNMVSAASLIMASSTMNVNLGSGSNTFNIQSTYSGASTTMKHWCRVRMW